MTQPAFTVKDRKPDNKILEQNLGENYTHLEKIREFVRAEIGETKEEWKYYGRKIGWTLKTFYKKRNLYFISIYEGWFQLSFVFGDRAFNTILDSDLSDQRKEELKSARKYAEGRGIGLKFDNPEPLADFRILLQHKTD
jgi:hypothetical protein